MQHESKMYQIHIMNNESTQYSEMVDRPYTTLVIQSHAMINSLLRALLLKLELMPTGKLRK